MKIKISAASNFLEESFVEGELLQIIEDLRQGKINISNIIDINCSWLFDEKNKTINNPKCFIIDYDQDDCDIEIMIYDYYK